MMSAAMFIDEKEMV